MAQGFLPLPLEAFAKSAGVSKALLYVYFPTQHDLFNALLERAVADLQAAGLEAASKTGDLETRACACADLYFRYVAQNGPLLHIILRDRFMAGNVGAGTARARDRVVRELTREVRRRHGLRAREAVAAVSIAIALPEECGRLTFHGDIEVERGAKLCRQLTLGAIDALTRSSAQLAG